MQCLEEFWFPLKKIQK